MTATGVAEVPRCTSSDHPSLIHRPLSSVTYGASSPTVTARFKVAVGIGIACGLASWLATLRDGFRGQDFASWWLAAHAVLAGRNPYTTVFVSDSLPGFLYPLPAALVTVPFAGLPVNLAGPLFIALTCGLLAFVVTREAWWPLLMFLSGSMYLSVAAAQFSPLLTLGLLVPGAMWLGALKPNIGLAMLAYRPSIAGALAMVLVAALSLVAMPSWLVEWIGAVRRSAFHYSPLSVPEGWLLLATLTRWRRPEARLLVAMAVLPSSPIVYEALPLFVIPRNRPQMFALSLLSFAALSLTMGYSLQLETDAYLRVARHAMVVLVYLPCAVMVLRRPNVAVAGS